MIDKGSTKCNGGLTNGFGRLFCCCFILSVSGAILVHAASEPKEDSVPPEIANQPPDHRSAHAHTADMSCCKPCVPTAADRDPDVAKRPCFLTALNRARVSGGVFPSAHDPDLSGDRIPEDEQAEFNRFLKQVFSDECLPESWDAARRSAYSGYTPDDVRIEVVSWKAPIGEVMASRVRKAPVIKLLLRVAPEHRMAVHVRPAPGPDFNPDARVVDEKHVFFDTKELNNALAGLFGARFGTPDDYVILGGTREYEGVLVFVGNVFSKGRDPTDPHWYNKLRLLVTDSDPQYMGITIDLRTEAKEQRSAP